MSASLVDQALQAQYQEQRSLSLADFMATALYHPQAGYYSRQNPIGRGGDFTTAPVMSSQFAYPIAKQCAHLFKACSTDEVMLLEVGPGSGHLACTLLLQLDAMGALPTTYGLLDVSPALRQAQQAYLVQHLPEHLYQRCRWFSDYPEAFSGAILANELFDAMPVHQIQCTDHGVESRCIVWQEGGWQWQNQPCTDPELQVACQQLAPWLDACEAGYITEVNLAAKEALRAMNASLIQGGMLFLDYGYSASEYYHPKRACGTLMAYENHQAFEDALERPGLRDLTSHVDFSSLAHHGLQLGLAPGGFANMANFLINAGFLEALAPAQQAGDLEAMAAAKQLLLPGGMGEVFKVIGFGKDATIDWQGFSRHNHWHRLGLEAFV